MRAPPGIGQKVDCSLLGGQIRLMGWTLTTAMWRDRNPVTGQARVTGTPQRPGLSASFNDRDGKPLVFQLNGGRQWKTAMTALGFYDALERAGFADLGVIVASDEQRATLLRTLDELFATGSRDDWVARCAAPTSSRRRSTRCSRRRTIPTCWRTATSPRWSIRSTARR